jgi:nucleotide-binding universal stress UspA family protein
MKSILVVGEDPRSFEGALVTAWLVAERFGSYVEGVATRALAMSITPVVGMGSVAPATFEGLEAEEVARAERLKDTALMGSDTPAMESALFDSGRPVLIAPQNALQFIGNVVLIAWNGASESARAVAFALPFLHAAGDVLILEVEGGSVVGPDAQDLRTYLARHGISSQSKTVALEGSKTGQVILDEATSLGADLIIKGAYTHSRLRQMIFGGATKHLLAASPIPVLMAH